MQSSSNELIGKLEAFGRYMLRRRYGQHTINTYLSILRVFFNYISVENLSQVTTQHAIDFNMNMEWNPNMAIGMDQADLNGDGRVATEMIQSNADTNTYIRTFTANLSPVVDNGNAADVFNAPNGGVVFQRIGNGIQITMVLRKQEAPNEGTVVSRITEFVIPRN